MVLYQQGSMDWWLCKHFSRDLSLIFSDPFLCNLDCCFAIIDPRTHTNWSQDYVYLITPNIWPLNKKYKDYQAPYYGLNYEVPILLTIILGLQHALTMIGSIVSPPLAIAGGAFNFNTTITIRTHDQRKEQQTVSIDLIWSVASFGACDVWGTIKYMMVRSWDVGVGKRANLIPQAITITQYLHHHWTSHISPNYQGTSEGDSLLHYNRTSISGRTYFWHPSYRI